MSAKVTKVRIDGIEWDRYDYGDDAPLFQRECDKGCDRGLLFAPARFCPWCNGSGFIIRRALVDQNATKAGQ